MKTRFEITPEPKPEEREALVTALERLLRDEGAPGTHPAYRSEWRAEGILESVGADYATARRRRTPGATRA